jgi:hypothetical protein
MENSKTGTKSKTSGRGKKTDTTAKTLKSGKNTSRKSLPGEDEIRLKAQEIYNDRLFRGEHGTAVDDWIKAEKLLKG